MKYNNFVQKEKVLLCGSPFNQWLPDNKLLFEREILTVSQTTNDSLPGNGRSIIDSEDQIDEWLARPEIDLQFDPFRERLADADPHLPHYLIGHDAFADLWGDWSTILFAPAGGGKSAFRVRLAYACRATEDGRRIFPINLALLNPEIPFVEQLLDAAANELLLHLLFKPEVFFQQAPETQQHIKDFLTQNLALPLAFRLAQLSDLLDEIEETDQWHKLASAFDPTAQTVFLPPSAALVRQLLAVLQDERTNIELDLSPEDRWQRLYLLLETLAYEATYILVDGIDAYLETQREPNRAITILEPVFQQAVAWLPQKIYVKLFLPVELKEPLLQNQLFSRLQEKSRVVTIEWTANKLRNLVSQRLLTASSPDRAVTSLDALCTPNLRNVESELLQVANALPRDLIMLVEQMFTEHVRQQGPRGKLDAEDLDAAVAWYQRRPGVTKHTSLAAEKGGQA
jgi:hypothetical protein